MEKMTYSTSELASLVGIHPNTVRFYEDIGFITKPERKRNGYRIYTELHRKQCILVRKAMKAEVLQNGLREKAVEIIRLCAEQNYSEAQNAGEEYCAKIRSELQNAHKAIQTVEELLSHRTTRKGACETGSFLDEKRKQKAFAGIRRSETAERLKVTPETLRTWERSGLLRIRRHKNGYRVYNADDLNRLNMIRTLRCANYSLSAILRLLTELDENISCSVEEALNTPRPDEDIVSVCDQLIVSLQNTLKDAIEILLMIDDMKKN